MSDENRLALGSGQEIQDYTIESVLGTGGFGIVYKAKHKYLDNKFAAIKEFLPTHLATREGATVFTIESAYKNDFDKGIESFINEAKQLVKFDKHPHIVDCQGFTKANGTAYLIMEYEDGYSLSDVINAKAKQGIFLDQSQIIHLMSPVIDGLAYVHSQNVLHRDIKPENIFIRSESEQPVLIDFGVSKQDFASSTKSTQSAYTPGYAPFEQTSESGDIGPWTDIYAIGMTMWVMVSHKNAFEYDSSRRAMAALKGKPDPLPSATSEGNGRYDNDFLAIIDQCLHIDESKRFQSMESLYQKLHNIKQGIAPADTKSDNETLDTIVLSDGLEEGFQITHPLNKQPITIKELYHSGATIKLYEVDYQNKLDDLYELFVSDYMSRNEDGSVYVDPKHENEIMHHLEVFFARGKCWSSCDPALVINRHQAGFQTNGTAYYMMEVPSKQTNLKTFITKRTANENQEETAAGVIAFLCTFLTELRKHEFSAIGLTTADIILFPSGEGQSQRVESNFDLLPINSHHPEFVSHWNADFICPVLIKTNGLITENSDIYSVGCIVYEFLTGKSSVPAAERLSFIQAGKRDPMKVDHLSTKGVYSENIMKLANDCVALESAKRVQSIAELRERLTEIINSPTYKRNIPPSPSMLSKIKRKLFS